MRVEAELGPVRLEEAPHSGAGAGEHENRERRLRRRSGRSGMCAVRRRAARAGRLDQLATHARARNCNAGRRPARTPIAIETAVLKRRTAVFSVITTSCGMEYSGINPVIRRSKICQGHSEHSARNRQDDSLGEQLLDHAVAGGAEGNAGGDLLQASGSTGEHQDGHIAAADEKQL